MYKRFLYALSLKRNGRLEMASYPRQNSLALGLREFGRIEHTLFTLDWLLDKDLRQRVTAGLNKGELKNTLAKAVCFNQLGELRDRSFEAQRHRASGLNLVVAAIILWNTVYLGSGHFVNKGAKSTMAYSRMWRRSIGTTSTSQAITPGARTNASRRAGSGHSGFRPSLSR
jgi:hypothetical protein